ncbi:MAG TPA: thioesterase family protein [Acidobacteriota bacterium]|nr:thioesterase family protein [Acidobacteriota bacterium]
MKAAAVNLRVRYAETDQMGVAYHSNYLVWFEVGRTNFCRSCGFTYAELEEQGIYLPVVEVHCRYRRPLRYDQEFRVLTHIRELRKRFISFGYVIETDDGDTPVAEGETRHVVTDREGRTTVLPSEYRDRMLNHM